MKHHFINFDQFNNRFRKCEDLLIKIDLCSNVKYFKKYRRTDESATVPLNCQNAKNGSIVLYFPSLFDSLHDVSGQKLST